MIESIQPRGLWLKWIFANGFGLAIGGMWHGFIGHGLTGEHQFWLTLPQFMMHTIGFIVLGMVALSIQGAVLKPLARAGYRQLLIKSAIICMAFWIGYYSGGIPVDIICGFAALGVINGLGLRGKVANWRRWMLASSIGFTLASGIVIAATLPIYKVLLAAFGGGLFGHVTLWTYIGFVGGIAAGFLTAPFLAKSLQYDLDTDANALADHSSQLMNSLLNWPADRH